MRDPLAIRELQLELALNFGEVERSPATKAVVGSGCG
jgi:hypothetical protein